MMREHDLPPAPSHDYDDALLARLRAVARQRDDVPEYVLAGARSIFVFARDDHADA